MSVLDEETWYVAEGSAQARPSSIVWSCRSPVRLRQARSPASQLWTVIIISKEKVFTSQAKARFPLKRRRAITLVQNHDRLSILL